MENQSEFKRYFTGWNFLINLAIAIGPLCIGLGIVQEATGYRAGLVMVLALLFGTMYAAGLTRDMMMEFLHTH